MKTPLMRLYLLTWLPDGVAGDVQMLESRHEAERELNERLQKIIAEKQSAVELAASLQRTLAAIAADKRHSERSAMRLQKDKNALKKTLDKVVQRVLFHFTHFTNTKLYSWRLDQILNRIEENNWP